MPLRMTETIYWDFYFLNFQPGSWNATLIVVTPLIKLVSNYTLPSLQRSWFRHIQCLLIAACILYIIEKMSEFFAGVLVEKRTICRWRNGAAGPAAGLVHRGWTNAPLNRRLRWNLLINQARRQKGLVNNFTAGTFSGWPRAPKSSC